MVASNWSQPEYQLCNDDHISCYGSSREVIEWIKLFEWMGREGLTVSMLIARALTPTPLDTAQAWANLIFAKSIRDIDAQIYLLPCQPTTDSPINNVHPLTRFIHWLCSPINHIHPLPIWLDTSWSRVLLFLQWQWLATDSPINYVHP